MTGTLENVKRWHLLFEQSGTFKNQFKKLGLEAIDYDILNDYGQTDVQIDIFSEIEKAFSGVSSIFENVRGGRYNGLFSLRPVFKAFHMAHATKREAMQRLHPRKEAFEFLRITRRAFEIRFFDNETYPCLHSEKYSPCHRKPIFNGPLLSPILAAYPFDHRQEQERNGRLVYKANAIFLRLLRAFAKRNSRRSYSELRKTRSVRRKAKAKKLDKPRLCKAIY